MKVSIACARNGGAPAFRRRRARSRRPRRHWLHGYTTKRGYMGNRRLLVRQHRREVDHWRTTRQQRSTAWLIEGLENGSHEPQSPNHGKLGDGDAVMSRPEGNSRECANSRRRAHQGFVRLMKRKSTAARTCFAGSVCRMERLQHERSSNHQSCRPADAALAEVVLRDGRLSHNDRVGITTIWVSIYLAEPLAEKTDVFTATCPSSSSSPMASRCY